MEQLRLDGPKRRGRHETRTDALIRRARAEGSLDGLDDGLVTALRALARQLDNLEAAGQAGTLGYVVREYRETLRAAGLTRDSRPAADDSFEKLIGSIHASTTGRSDTAAT